MEVAGLVVGVEMEAGVENKDCRDVEPDSDFTTPLPAIVELAGVEKLMTDTAGAAYGVTDTQKFVSYEYYQQYQQYSKKIKISLKKMQQ